MNVNQSVNAAKAAKSSIIYWEQLFRGRIILQKSLQIANQLPVVDDLLELAEEEDMKMSTDITTSQTMLKSLLEELVGQQTLSVAANEQQRPNKKGKQSSSSTNPSFADEDEAWQAIHTTDEMLMQSKWRPALTAMHRKVNGFSGRQSQQQKELKVFQTSFWDKVRPHYLYQLITLFQLLCCRLTQLVSMKAMVYANLACLPWLHLDLVYLLHSKIKTVLIR